MTHNELQHKAALWMRKTGRYGINSQFVKENANTMVNEIVDVIGFSSGLSVVFEIKVSLSDYRADMKKASRDERQPQLGNYHYYVTPKGLLNDKTINELKRTIWGLIEYDGVEFNIILKSVRNKNIDYEKLTNIMYGIIRRSNKSGVLG